MATIRISKNETIKTLIVSLEKAIGTKQLGELAYSLKTYVDDKMEIVN